MLRVLCLITTFAIVTSLNNTESSHLSTLLKIERILYKRNAVENVLKDNPDERCRNGGIFAGGICHCIHPNTGPTCQDFSCLHGVSVGHRFDPNSLLFSRPCICDEGWRGELCQFHLTEKCTNRGEWKANKCECIGEFFGDECQYTSRCDFGVTKHGRCICNRGFEGPYCDRIVCYHGYADFQNGSHSCVCPAKFKGDHCDQCAQQGPKIQSYPVCVIDMVNHAAKTSRIQNSQQIRSRVLIMGGAISFLLIVGLVMFLLHAWHQRKRDPEAEAIKLQALSERSNMLTDAAMRVDEEHQLTIPKKERKRSITNPFRMNLRKASTVERNSVQRPSFNREVSTRSEF